MQVTSWNHQKKVHLYVCSYFIKYKTDWRVISPEAQKKSKKLSYLNSCFLLVMAEPLNSKWNDNITLCFIWLLLLPSVTNAFYTRDSSPTHGCSSVPVSWEGRNLPPERDWHNDVDMEPKPQPILAFLPHTSSAKKLLRGESHKLFGKATNSNRH